MKKQHFLTFLLSMVLLISSFHGVHAQSNGMSIGGDEICGASTTTECSAKDAKRIVVGAVYNFIIPIGSALLVVFIMWRFILAYKALVEGNSGAYKEALGKAVNAIIGLMVVLLVISGAYIAILKFLGVQDQLTTVFNFFSQSFIPHAYAATNGTILPPPLAVTSLYDLLLLIVRLIVRWFVFPAVVVMWIWTGFSYVAAQGAPVKIALAHKWLLYALITTVIIMTTEGFLFALRGTIEQIVPQQQMSAPSNSSNDVKINPNAPTDGATGAACSDPETGITGQINSDGVCRAVSRGATTGAVTSCSGQPVGTSCTITGSTRAGACDYNGEGTYGCYVK